MKALAGIALAVLSLAACNDKDSTSIITPGDSARGAVYTMNNAAAANYVNVYSRAANGTLTRMDSVATSGRGSGPDPMFGTDPLGSQDAVLLNDTHTLLFVV